MNSSTKQLRPEQETQWWLYPWQQITEVLLHIEISTCAFFLQFSSTCQKRTVTDFLFHSTIMCLLHGVATESQRQDVSSNVRRVKQPRHYSQNTIVQVLRVSHLKPAQVGASQDTCPSHSSKDESEPQRRPRCTY